MNNEERILALLEEMRTDITELKAGQAKLEAGQEAMSGRLDRLEEHLDEVDSRSQRTAVILENDVARNIRLLFEGHEAIMEKLDTLASKDRVEVLESDVSLLKDAVKLMRQEIDELKRAQ